MTSLDDRKFLRELGQRVLERRKARGWNQRQFAEQCKLHRTFVGSVERGERNISILNLRLLARVLRVSVDDLLRDL